LVDRKAPVVPQEPEPDLVEIIRQTLKFKELWATHSKLGSAEHVKSTSGSEHLVLRHDIDNIQKKHFPWLANTESKPPGLQSVFDLDKSHEREAGIVIATGKGDFRWMMHLVNALRNVLNCSLPIEMYLHRRSLLTDSTDFTAAMIFL
jgi:hypothetical protein